MISESVFGDAINHLPFADWLAAVKYKDVSSGELINLNVTSLEG